MYIKDLQSGDVRKYGTNPHDALRVSPDGTILSYENLQNGDGSRFGDYRFCDKDGLIPEEDEVLVKHGADAYFNIGGFVEVVRCKDCKYKYLDDMVWNCPFGLSGGENFFCGYGAKDGEADDE